MSCPVQRIWRPLTMPVYHGDATLSLVQMESARFLTAGFLQIYFPFLTIRNLQEDTVRLRSHCFPANLNPMASARINDPDLIQSLLWWWQKDVSNSILPSTFISWRHLLRRERPLVFPLPLPSLPVPGSFSLRSVVIGSGGLDCVDRLALLERASARTRLGARPSSRPSTAEPGPARHTEPGDWRLDHNSQKAQPGCLPAAAVRGSRGISAGHENKHKAAAGHGQRLQEGVVVRPRPG